MNYKLYNVKYSTMEKKSAVQIVSTSTQTYSLKLIF